MTRSKKLILLGFITGLLIFVAFPVLQKEAPLMGLWMILWSRISLRKGSVYGIWKLLTYITLVIGWILLLFGILLTALEYIF
ncbi:Immunity protein [Brevibacillus sp. IT-7CA2]